MLQIHAIVQDDEEQDLSDARASYFGSSHVWLSSGVRWFIFVPPPIRTSERYAELARKHIAKTGSTAREIWQLIGQEKCDKKNVGWRCSRIVRATKALGTGTGGAQL